LNIHFLNDDFNILSNILIYCTL